jgi:aquaporin related protein
MFITAALVLSVLMLAAEKHQATPFAPVSAHIVRIVVVN